MTTHATGCPACYGDAVIEFELLTPEPSTGFRGGWNVLQYFCEHGCRLSPEKLDEVVKESLPEIEESIYYPEWELEMEMDA